MRKKPLPMPTLPNAVLLRAFVPDEWNARMAGKWSRWYVRWSREWVREGTLIVGASVVDAVPGEPLTCLVMTPAGCVDLQAVISTPYGVLLARSVWSPVILVAPHQHDPDSLRICRDLFTTVTFEDWQT